MSFISSTAGGIKTKQGTVIDKSIVRWDGTDGKFVQDSEVVVDDNGYISSAGNLIDDNIALGVSLTIPTHKQLIVAETYYLYGDLTINGLLRVL